MRFERFRLPALGVMLALAAPLSPARADCVSDCQASTYCDSDMNASGECGRRRNDCYLSQCNNSNNNSSRSTRHFGAIAYGAESEAYGFSYDQPNEAAADRRALSECGKHGDDCKIVISFLSGCAAVAAGTNNRFGTGQATTRQQAQATALGNCGRKGGDSCEVKAWTCASR